MSHSIRVCAAIFVLFLFTVATASGQEPEADSPKKSFVLPFEFDYDSGADNGNALISRFIPVNSFYVSERGKLVNVAMIIVADAPGGVPGSPGNPDPVPGPKAFGLGDLTDAIFYTPTKSKGLLWGVGVALGIPTATDDVLGSGKWLAGPAFRLGHQAGPWRFGMLATNRWSFAGDSDRADINQLLVRGLIRRNLPKDWFFLYAPIITANWDAASGQKWLVPLGGGFGKSFKQFNVSMQAYINAIKPDGAPNSVYRIGFTIPFRLPSKP